MNKITKGMTLIEIIISIAILGILAVSFLSMFMMGFSGITSAGNRSKAEYAAQTKVEENLSTETSSGSDKLTIYFQGSTSDKIEVQGSIGTEDAVINGKEVNITFFKPNK